MASFTKFVDGNGTSYDVKDAVATQAIADLTSNGLSCHEVANVNDIINTINSRGVVAGYGATAPVIMTTSTTVTFSNGTEVPAWTSMMFNGVSNGGVTGIAVDQSGAVYSLYRIGGSRPRMEAYELAKSSTVKTAMDMVAGVTNGLYTAVADSGATFRSIIYNWFGQQLSPDGEQIVSPDTPLCIQYTGTAYTLDSPFDLEANDTIYLFGNGTLGTAVGLVLGDSGVLRGTIHVLNCTVQGSSIYGNAISSGNNNRKEETLSLQQEPSHTYVHELDDAAIRSNMGPGTIVKCTSYDENGGMLYDFLAYLQDTARGSGAIFCKKITDSSWTPLTPLNRFDYSSDIYAEFTPGDVSSITVEMSNFTAPLDYTFITQRIA
jgi:hypothetical protein